MGSDALVEEKETQPLAGASLHGETETFPCFADLLTKLLKGNNCIFSPICPRCAVDRIKCLIFANLQDLLYHESYKKLNITHAHNWVSVVIHKL